MGQTSPSSPDRNPLAWVALGSGLLTAGLLIVGCGAGWVPHGGMLVLLGLMPVQAATAGIAIAAGLAGWRRARQGRPGRVPSLVGLGVGIGWVVVQVVGWSTLVATLVGVAVLAAAVNS